MRPRPSLALLLACTVISGCATLSAPTEPHDPFESYNRVVHNINQSFDKSIATPVAQTYQNVMPDWADKGVTNFFGNLDDVTVLANDLLQLKFDQAASDAARILFNTTAGLLGLIDVATHMDLPKHNEDFGQTLGYWGVPSGPYFVLPFFGPSSIRDTVGISADYTYFDPVIRNVEHVNARSALFVSKFVDTRADFLSASRILETAALDHYIYTREAYLQRRQYHVYDGDPPEDDFDDFDDFDDLDDFDENEENEENGK
ncbi:MAG: VacJ family lipoprotein [Ectothiorhodospiraceae bacterium]|nr:VacJ family lipoprotein [Ectothiorhodospiraceae bacterium]